MRIKALDTFAGTGWGVACKWLNIEEDGVEIMPEAVATREANGMSTIYRDVWEGILLSREEHEAKYGTYDLKISSPPCQTFSVAGAGAGRRALDEVIRAIQLHAYKDPAELLAFGEKHDMRTALVLTPLAYIWRDRPRLVALEQVPTVLPVWEAYAEIMAELGYSVKTAVLNAEQYGVPQTRRRAILVARLDGEVQLPKPTHSRYYSRTPDKLDPGVKKWVSMAEALGWGHEGPAPSISGDPRIAPRGCKHPKEGCCTNYPGTPGRQFPEGTVTVTVDEASALQTFPRFTQNNKLTNQAVRPLTHPAPTVTAGHDSGNRGFLDEDGNLTVATPKQVAALQSYPESIVFRNGNQANSAKRSPDQPAPTIHFSQRANKVEWMDPELAADPAASGKRVTVDEAATLQSYPVVGFPRLSDGKAEVVIDGTAYRARDLRPADEPALTITEKARSWKVFDADGSERRMTTAEAGVLQTYERPFEWRGAKTKQFLQIGNAVPPVLARAVLAALITDTTDLKGHSRDSAKQLITTG